MLKSAGIVDLGSNFLWCGAALGYGNPLEHLALKFMGLAAPNRYYNPETLHMVISDVQTCSQQ